MVPASFTERNQYQTGFVVSSSGFCGNTHPTCLSHVTVSTIICLVKLSEASTGWNTRSSSNAFDVASSSSRNGSNAIGWSISRAVSNRAASRAKLGTNRRNKLYRPKNDLSSVMSVGSRTPRNVSVVWDATSRRLARIVCPGYSIISKKNWQFLTSTVLSALFERYGTSSMRRLCSSYVMKIMAMSSM